MFSKILPQPMSNHNQQLCYQFYNENNASDFIFISISESWSNRISISTEGRQHLSFVAKTLCWRPFSGHRQQLQRSHLQSVLRSTNSQVLLFNVRIARTEMLDFSHHPSTRHKTRINDHAMHPCCFVEFCPSPLSVVCICCLHAAFCFD